ncbi:PDZ domain-containing protein [Sphingobium yanoikuyae]|uniref:PDZ domain-containing protein n=1 Tax=Sphingobium yanoikuyae TaxID=13690 RepID=UPI000262C2D9|nr:PDZ domain-containing protein [Sphingobium yanoikuyae]
MKHRYIVASVLALCSTPAAADEFLAVTPSGAVETIFADKPAGAIAKLSSKCIDARWTVITSSSNELVCEAPMNMGQSIMGQLLMGNSYSTPPRRFFRFNVAGIEGDSRVQASGWMELQMAFGQMKRTDFSGPEFMNSIMSFMAAAGGQYPVGTTFPNHAAMGIEGADAPQGKFLGIRVVRVLPGSAAARAGIAEGDIVVRIAGKQFKAMDEYLDATAKAAQTPTYPVGLLRGGKPMTLTLDRDFRPSITSITHAGPDAPTPVTIAGAAPSVADELAKLAKLKSDGILTDAEFETQKKKLLGQ